MTDVLIICADCDEDLLLVDEVGGVIQLWMM